MFYIHLYEKSGKFLGLYSQILPSYALLTLQTAVPAEGNGNLQTLICVLVARPRRCLTLSNPVP